MAHVKECRTEAEIVALYRRAHDRLWNPPSIRIAAAAPPNDAPPPDEAGRPSRPPIDHDPDAPPLAPADIPIIIRVVAGFFRVPVVVMTSPDRRVRLILPRFIAIHLARVMTHATNSELCRVFKRDHSTIKHALNKMDAKLASDPGLAATVARVRERVMRFHEQQPQGGRTNDEHRTG